MSNLSSVKAALSAGCIPHIAVASNAIPPVKDLRCVNLIEFLDHCVSWEVITAEEKIKVVHSLQDMRHFFNDSYISGHMLWDAEHYAWTGPRSDEALMQRIGKEFRTAYPQRVDILYVSW